MIIEYLLSKERDSINKIIGDVNGVAAISYGLLNDRLPTTINSAQKIDAVLELLQSAGIQVTTEKEEAKARHRQKRQQTADLRTDYTPDLIRQYLDDLGKLPLLTEEEEQSLGKQIQILRYHFVSSALRSEQGIRFIYKHCKKQSKAFTYNVQELSAKLSANLPKVEDIFKKISSLEERVEKGKITKKYRSRKKEQLLSQAKSCLEETLEMDLPLQTPLFSQMKKRVSGFKPRESSRFEKYTAELWSLEGRKEEISRGWYVRKKRRLEKKISGYSGKEINPDSKISKLNTIAYVFNSIMNECGELANPNQEGWTRQMIKRYRKLQEARQDLTKGNLRLVVSLAKKYQGRHISFYDLIEEGNIGLMRAVNKYDPYAGTKFGTFATYWIRQNLARAVNNNSRTVRISVHTIEAATKIKRIAEKLRQKLGREPYIYEIAKKARIKPKKVEYLFGVIKNPLSLQRSVDLQEHKDSDFIDILEDKKAENPISKAYHNLLKTEENKALMNLTYRERQIIMHRFGLNGYYKKPLMEIGKMFKLTRERVRQIEAQALRKLQHPRNSKTLESFLPEFN